MKESGMITMPYLDNGATIKVPQARVPEGRPDTFRTAAGILTGILAGGAVWLVLAALLLRL
jgi:hypothetical protein